MKKFSSILLIMTTVLLLIGGVYWKVSNSVGSILIGPKSVILHTAAARRMFNPCSRQAPASISGFWDPSVEEAKQLEARLPGFLNGDLVGYYRQYAGFWRNGRKMIYVNAMRRPLSSDWKIMAEVACDGGESVFGLEYDVESQQFSNILFNGP